jgi:chromosome segregation protein
VPAQSEQYQAALAIFNASQSAWLNTEQQLRIEQANIVHIARSTTETNELLKRLQENLAALQLPSDELLQQKQAELSGAEAEVEALEVENASRLAREQQLNIEIKSQRESSHIIQRELHVLEAEIASLNKIQQSMREGNNEASLTDWINNAGLSADRRVWESVRIKAGWETAFEAALGSRLNAIAHNTALDWQVIANRPPAAVSLAWSSNLADKKASKSSQHTPLYSLIERVEPAQQAMLQDWLTGIYLLEEGENAIAASTSLADGESLVSKHGDLYTRHSVTYFGAQSSLHGVLERQVRLEFLEAQLPQVQQQLAHQNGQVTRLEAAMQALRAGQHAHQQTLKSVTQRAHQLNLGLQQLKQQQSNAIQRQKMLQSDCIVAEEKLHRLHNEGIQKKNIVSEINERLTALQNEKNMTEANKLAAESFLNEARQQLQRIEREHQDKHFNIKLISNNINELNYKLEFLNEEKSSLKLRCAEVESTLAATKMEALKANLEAAINTKQSRESALASARNQMSECDAALQFQERTRLQNEQMLHPLRDKLEASRLSEQEARLHFEQCQAELAVLNIEESLLAEHLNQLAGAEAKVSDLERRKNRLEFDIEALGAVNLAAIQELETEQTRRQYLNSQCQDLTEASQTLEDAIKKIDRETRGRLQLTFDEANKHFNELFTTLFGGGQARLELLGDEILDTGMQVFAQPPGKKNSTIHLLSGGEKALTALALVFALFRLNPAPFCLMDEVDAPLDDSNTERFCTMVKKMSERTQFLYVSHNKITMEMAQQLIGVTMQESGVSRIVDVDMEAAVRMVEAT